MTSRLKTASTLVPAGIAVLLACGCGEPNSPTLSGAGLIALNMRDAAAVWDIYTVNPDGSNLRNLTRSLEDDLYPAWAPGSRRLAFVSAREPAGIYTMNAQGGDQRLVHSGLMVEHLTWSPDGRQIAFQATSGSGWELYIVNADGSGLRNITNSPDAEFAPDWSPTGSRILFNNSFSDGDILVINADGSGRTNLTPGTPSVEQQAAWSPDGSSIAFVSTIAGPSSIYVMNADGTNWRRVTTPGPESSDALPDWSPDGSEIVFARDRPGGTQVFAVRVDGGGLRALVSPLSGHPSW